MRTRLVTSALLLLAACGSNGSRADPLDASPSRDAHALGVRDATARDASIDYRVLPYRGAPVDGGPARVPVHAEMLSNRVDVRQLLFAAGEMQISGEPFASGFAGRNLGDYDRSRLPPNLYILNLGTPEEQPPITDLFGFSTAVESYEYSKYYMNMVVEETTAGVSLASGPVVSAGPGATPLARLVARMNDVLTSAGSNIGGGATLPAPPNNIYNYLGFPGLWPSFAPFADFDPTMYPSGVIMPRCDFAIGYNNTAPIASAPTYECIYNTTHLANASAQVNRTLLPSVLGYATWKEALWAIDFAGRIHDTAGTQITALLSQADLALVGTASNTVQGTAPTGAAVGTYIGSSPIEGMWGLTMLVDMDNESEWLRSALMTSDGFTLTGLSPLAATSYDYTSPLVWFPNGIAVTEDDSVAPYPPVTGLAITDATSTSEGLGALLLGHAMFFGMTDARNAGVGQRIGLEATFDGDPFPPDDGAADGQATAHDRSLEILRVAFVDLDRMHADEALGILVDTASVSGRTLVRGTTVTTSNLAHVLIGLRQTLLSVNGAITQYGAANPDPNVDQLGILNPLPIHPTYGVDGGSLPTFSERVRSVFMTNAAFVRDVLTAADGSVVNGATIAGGVATPMTTPATLETQTAALRALIEGFLLTGDATYQTRARAVASHLIGAAFYSAAGRLFRGVEASTDEVTMTPELFGFLQSSLRETYKSLYVQGDPALDRSVLEDRIARVNKLFLNGWDDLNGNQHVDYPQECLVTSGGVPIGGLQMAEQPLTGELGYVDGGGHPRDRDLDCVPELSHTTTASVMASSLHFHSP